MMLLLLILTISAADWFINKINQDESCIASLKPTDLMQQADNQQ